VKKETNNHSKDMTKTIKYFNLKGVPKSKEFTLPDDGRHSLEELHVVLELQQLRRRGRFQIQLIAEGAAHGHEGAGANTGVVAGDVVGHGGHVGPHATGRVSHRCAVLDLHAHQGISVVRAPYLGAEVQHARIKPTPCHIVVYSLSK